MNIAILNELLGRSRGGIEAWIYHASEELLKLGHEVTLINAQNETPNDAGPAGVCIITLKKFSQIPIIRSAFSAYFLVNSFKTQLRDKLAKFDIIWTRSPFMAYIASKLLPNKKVVFIHAAPHLYYGKASFNDYKKTCNKTIKNMLIIAVTECNFRFIGYYETTALKRCINVYLSETRKNETIEFYGLEDDPKRFFVIPAGVNTDRFYPTNDLWNGEGKLKLISVCRLVPGKNIQCVLHALAILKGANLKVCLTIVGEGSYEQELKDLSDELGLTKEDVCFAGRQENVGLWYRERHLFVLPSLYEGFGSVYIEAMASGLPCIAIKNKPGKYLVAADEIIDQDKNGWLMNENDPEELARIVKHVYQHPDLIASYSKEARKKAVEVFSWRQTVNGLLKLDK